MKIRAIRVHREALGLVRPYTIAYRTVSSTSICWIEMEGDNGQVGIGAANPSQMVTGESLDMTEAALQEEAEQLIGRPILGLRAFSEELLARRMAVPAARAALDIAFHDLYAKTQGYPLLSLLGQQHDTLPTSITIGIKGVGETIEEAGEYLGRGFRYLKIKLGNDLAEDLERLYKLRERFGDTIFIRVDANQGYSLAETQQFFRETEGLQLELVEQPLPYDQVELMRGLPWEQRRRIAADESLKSYEHALHLLRPEVACGIFNIKLMKSGGIYPSLQIADLARRSGVKLMWGCNDESIVSITAALHAAFACPNTRYLDLDGSLDLARDIVSGGFRLRDGFLQPIDAPGLGIHLQS